MVRKDGDAEIVQDVNETDDKVRGKLRLANDAAHARAEKFLPSIAALIDQRQFELISRPSAGLIVIQGSAGSGKTTIGLHRIAYLSFMDPKRFRPERMLVVVYQKALANYVSRVLPSLEVPGVSVVTFFGWAEKLRKTMFPSLGVPLTDMTPTIVVRAKSHGAMLKIINDRQAVLAADIGRGLEKALQGRPIAPAAMKAWRETKGPVDKRLAAMRKFAERARTDPGSRMSLETAVKRLRRRTRDVVGEWAAMLTDRQGLLDGFNRHAPGTFTEDKSTKFTSGVCVATAFAPARKNWKTRTKGLCLGHRGRCLAAAHPPGPARPVDASQGQAHRLRAPDGGRGARLCPGRAGGALGEHHETPVHHLAGDVAQAIAAEHGFSDWSVLLEDLQIPHDRVEPLQVSYRSTRQILEVAQAVLGPLKRDVPPVAPRTGPAVEYFGFGMAGEACEFLANALKALLREEPQASVALIARHPEQARLYHQTLVRAEVPGLRLVASQDFSFKAGIDVTDVRQTKGLEFDVVILLEVNEASYPATDAARRLLHVAVTRAAHQLWVTYTGKVSPLIPEENIRF